jgi:hypothetical protein
MILPLTFISILLSFHIFRIYWKCICLSSKTVEDGVVLVTIGQGFAIYYLTTPAKQAGCTLIFFCK